MKKKNIWPSVSVAIATRNSQRTLAFCLNSIKNQNYPANIEIVIADGGSIDKTLEIAKEFKAKVINVPENKQNAEYNKGVAVNNCKNELLLMIDHDNILPHKNWLKRMVKPLIEEEEVFGSGVLRFHYDIKMTLVDRYSALLGGTDPVPFFFNKSAHQSYLYSGFHLKGKVIKERDSYIKVKLNPNSLPALGGNGSILRRKFIEKYHFEDHSKRRYSIYNPKTDKLALIGFVFYSISIILPTIDSIRGFLKVADIAWFLHPLMCLGILTAYGITTIKEGIKNVFLAR